MRNSISEELKVIIWKCSTNVKCFLPLLIWKYKMMTKNYSTCMPNWSWLTSDLYTSFNEAACMLAWKRLCHNAELEMIPFSGALCFAPSPPNLTLVMLVRGWGLYVNPNQSQLLAEQPGGEWQYGFSCIKRCMWSTENKISFCLWWVQFSNHYGIWRKCQCSDFV